MNTQYIKEQKKTVLLTLLSNKPYCVNLRIKFSFSLSKYINPFLFERFKVDKNSLRKLWLAKNMI